MEKTAASASADAFIDQHPEVLDSNIMLTHYSAGLLFSDRAAGIRGAGQGRYPEVLNR